MTPMFKCAACARIAPTVIHYLTNPIQNRPDSAAIPSSTIMAWYCSFCHQWQKITWKCFTGVACAV